MFANNITVSGAATGNANVVGTVTGNLGLRAISTTYTDNSAAPAATIANTAVHGIGTPTLAAANTGVISNNAATFFIEGAPIAGTNMTIANAYALHVESGNALFAGNIMGRLANGNSSVNMPAANGNINLTAVGNTTLIVTGTGANITGTLNTGIGNANVGNLGTATLIATAANTGLVQNSTSNLTIASAGNVSLFVAGATPAKIIASTVGANVTGTLGVTGNATVGNLITSALIANGNVNVNQNATDIFTIAALQPPTTDMVVITNTGQAVATAGVSAMQINYVGGTGAIEASAVRADMTPGTTSGSTWNAYRVAATAAAVSGVTFNGIKFDNKTAGAGTSRAFSVGTGYDEILNYNGTIVIDGVGVINGAQVGNLGTANAVIVGNGTSIVKSVSPGTAGNVLTSDGTNWVSQVGGGGGGGGSSIVNGTSNVSVALNGNITMGVTGVANVVVVSNTAVNISEVATVTAPGLTGKTMMISAQYLSV